MLSLSSASAGELSSAKGRSLEEIVEHYQIEADYYRHKAAALERKYEPATTDESAVARIVVDALRIRLEEEFAHLRRLQKASEPDRQAIGVSELYTAHIQREIAKLENSVSQADAIEA